MAFPTTGIIDDFNRADAGTLGAAYSVDPGNAGGSDLQIISNQAAGNWLPATVYRNDATFGPDTEVYITAPVLPAGAFSDIRVYARLQSPDTASADCYLGVAEVNASIWRIYRMTDTGLTSLASAAQVWSANDTLGMEALGTGATVTINLYRNWSLLGTVDDTDAARITAAGYIGFGNYDPAYPAGRLDDFGGGTSALPGIGVTSPDYARFPKQKLRRVAA